MTHLLYAVLLGCCFCSVYAVHGHRTYFCQGGEEKTKALLLATISIGSSSWISFLPQAVPEKAYKKGHRRYARGLKFCMLWMSAILPTTGPAKIKVKTKAKGLGFVQGSGGSEVEHNFTIEVCAFELHPWREKCQ